MNTLQAGLGFTSLAICPHLHNRADVFQVFGGVYRWVSKMPHTLAQRFLNLPPHSAAHSTYAILNVGSTLLPTMIHIDKRVAISSPGGCTAAEYEEFCRLYFAGTLHFSPPCLSTFCAQNHRSQKPYLPWVSQEFIHQGSNLLLLIACHPCSFIGIRQSLLSQIPNIVAAASCSLAWIQLSKSKYMG